MTILLQKTRQKHAARRDSGAPWYRQIPASDPSTQDSQENESMKKGKRKFERQFDSGVSLGSDGTEADEEELDNVLSTTSKLPRDN